MGNNSGRSKGCKTCLQRRVKCDQTRPICKRCSKAKFTCQGYRDHFINDQEQVLRRLNRGSTSGWNRTSPSETAKKEQPLPDQTFKALEHILSYNQESHVWPTLSALPWKDDIVISYLVADFTGPMGTICHNVLAPSFQADSLQRIATKQCFLALATTFFGIGNAQQSLVSDGRRLYGQALKMVNATIGDSSHPELVEILSSVVSLCLHEAIAPTQAGDHSWLHHIFGLEQLFAIHGPPSEQSGMLHNAVLEATRLTMIVAALYTRRPSLMALPEWSAATNFTLNDDSHSSSGSALAYLIDALAQIPTLYCEQDAIKSGPRTQEREISTSSGETSNSPSPIRSLLSRSLNLLDNVRSQRMQWKISHLNSEFPSLPCTHIPSTQPYPCMVVTHFSSLDAANTCTFYNALVILLNQFVISMCPLLPVSDLDLLANEFALEQTSNAVMEILKSIDYHIPFAQSEATSTAEDSGPRNFYLLFPLRVAYKALSGSRSPEAVSQKLWLEDVFDIIQGRAGPWASNKQIFKIGES